MVLVLVPDTAGRVWILAETCAACASAVPRGTIVRGQRQALKPSPQQNLRTPPSAPQGARSKRRKDLPPAVVNCRICSPASTQAQDSSDTENKREHKDERTVTPQPSTPVPANAGLMAMSTLRYLDRSSVGRHPQERLLALLLAIRVRKGGSVNVDGKFLTMNGLTGHEEALHGLTTTGWLDRTTDKAKREQESNSPTWHIPRLHDGATTYGVSRSLQPQLRAWIQRVVDHPALRGRQAEQVLAALQILCTADHLGLAEVKLHELARLCSCPGATRGPSSRAAGLSLLTDLVEAGWLLHVEAESPDPQTARVELAGCAWPVLPAARPSAPSLIHLCGKGHRIAAWVDAYVARHGHGPRRRELLTPHCPENPNAPWPQHATQQAVEALAKDGWLVIPGSQWHRIRPGPAYLNALAAQQAGQTR